MAELEDKLNSVEKLLEKILDKLSHLRKAHGFGTGRTQKPHRPSRAHHNVSNKSRAPKRACVVELETRQAQAED